MIWRATSCAAEKTATPVLIVSLKFKEFDVKRVLQNHSVETKHNITPQSPLNRQEQNPDRIQKWNIGKKCIYSRTALHQQNVHAQRCFKRQNQLWTNIHLSMTLQENQVFLFFFRGIVGFRVCWSFPNSTQCGPISFAKDVFGIFPIVFFDFSCQHF